MENFTLKDAMDDDKFFEYAKESAERVQISDSITRSAIRDGVFKNAGTFKKHFIEVIEKRSELPASKRVVVKYIGMIAANRVYKRKMIADENR